MSKRDAYIEKAQAKVDEHAAKIQQLKAQAKGGVADKKISAHNQLEKLEAKLDAAKAKLAEVKDSAEDAWEDVASRFESLADEVGASVKKFFSK